MKLGELLIHRKNISFRIDELKKRFYDAPIIKEGESIETIFGEDPESVLNEILNLITLYSDISLTIDNLNHSTQVGSDKDKQTSTLSVLVFERNRCKKVLETLDDISSVLSASSLENEISGSERRIPILSKEKIEKIKKEYKTRYEDFDLAVNRISWSIEIPPSKNVEKVEKKEEDNKENVNVN